MCDYKLLAQELFFSKELKVSEFLAKHNIEYRKDKTISDIINARDKALKRGNGRVEYELSWFALYLKNVFKDVKLKFKIDN